MARIFNFSAGPSTLPLPVLEQVRDEMVDYHGSGMSLIESSHRGPEYSEVHQQAGALMKELLGLGDNYKVMFIQGGATMQFTMIAYNLLSGGREADYTLTFRRLADDVDPQSARQSEIRTLFDLPDALSPWLAKWRERLAAEPGGLEETQRSMDAANPAFIPRNHLVEEVIRAAVDQDDFAPFHALVEVLPPQEGVAVGALDLEDAVADLEDRDIEGAPAEIEHRDGLVAFRIEAECEGRRGGLVDDPHHVEARDLAGILGGLALRVVEIGGYRDHRVGDRLAEEVRRDLLHLGQDDRRDLLGGEPDCSTVGETCHLRFG